MTVVTKRPCDEVAYPEIGGSILTYAYLGLDRIPTVSACPVRVTLTGLTETVEIRSHLGCDVTKQAILSCY